jgi:hypothetical protein
MPIDYERKYQNFIDTENGVIEGGSNPDEFVDYHARFTNWSSNWRKIVRDALSYEAPDRSVGDEGGWNLDGFDKPIILTLTIITKEQIKKFPTIWKEFAIEVDGIEFEFEMDSFKFKKLPHVENGQKSDVWEYALKYECINASIEDEKKVEQKWRS